MKLIDVDELIPNGVFYINANDPLISLDELLNRITNAPTIDAEPVVRCKDCVHRMVWHSCQGKRKNDFCSYGERNSTDA